MKLVGVATKKRSLNAEQRVHFKEYGICEGRVVARSTFMLSR
jgi:hypothetical protein